MMIGSHTVQILPKGCLWHSLRPASAGLVQNDNDGAESIYNTIKSPRLHVTLSGAKGLDCARAFYTATPIF